MDLEGRSFATATRKTYGSRAANRPDAPHEAAMLIKALLHPSSYPTKKGTRIGWNWPSQKEGNGRNRQSITSRSNVKQTGRVAPETWKPPEKKRDERGRPIAHTRRSPDKNKGTKISPPPNEVNGRTKIAAREQRNGENSGGGGWLECSASRVVKVRYSR